MLRLLLALHDVDQQGGDRGRGQRRDAGDRDHGAARPSGCGPWRIRLILSPLVVGDGGRRQLHVADRAVAPDARDRRPIRRVPACPSPARFLRGSGGSSPRRWRGSPAWRDRFVEALGGEIEGVPEAVPRLGVVLPDEVVRHVAVVAHRHRAVAGLQPAVVLFVHDVAVGARARNRR